MKQILFFAASLLITINIFAQIKSEVTDFDVYKYNINLDISQLETSSIKGFTEIIFVSETDKLSKLNFYLQELNIDSIIFRGNKLSTFNYNDTIIKITLPSIISLQEKDSIKIYYQGKPTKDPSNWGGFYFTSTYAYNMGVGFESNPHNFGRVWFPCVDNFTDKAIYDIKITTDIENKAICGGILAESLQVDNNKTQWHWILNNPIPTYLASVAVGPYTCVTDTFVGIIDIIPIEIYVPTNYVSKVSASFSNLKNILATYERLFGPYKWDRVGYVGVPFNSGAMEHASNIAYPLNCIDGGLTYESLYAHELSHHWFGNLVTCSTPEEMWINEGWAVFSEFVYTEAIYGKKAATDYVRTKLASVLKSAHYEDEGFYAVGNVPHKITYGTTVYDKGGLVVHTLRNYMGDSLFFATVKKMNSNYQYKNITCQEMCDYFSNQSGINLQDFFDTWVFQTGFPHFNINYFETTENNNTYTTKIAIKQKNYGKTEFANNNRIELCFMNNNWQTYKKVVSFSGENAIINCEVPFRPDIIICDKDEKTADAIVSYDQTIKNTGTISNSSAYVTLQINKIVDSCYIRSELHWVAPDEVKDNQEIFRISKNHYWTINGIFSEGSKISAQFSYNRSPSATNNYLDCDLLPTINSSDSLILVYRKDSKADWQIIPFTKSGGSTIGKLKIENVKIGEYALGIGYPNQSNVKKNENKKNGLIVFPNPASKFTIESNNILISKICITNIAGKTVFEGKIDNKIEWNPNIHNAETYIISAYDKKGHKIAVEKIYYQGQ